MSSNNETGEIIVATRVATASIAAATVPTFSPSSAISSSMKTEVGEHILSNTASYNFINENDSEEYYTNITDIFNFHNKNENYYTNQVERIEQSIHSNKTDSMEFYDADDKCARCSSFYTSHSNVDDCTKRREQSEELESIEEKEESELELLENKVDVKLEKTWDKTKAEVVEAQATKEERSESELEWQFSFACSLPQIPIIETDEDDDDDDDDVSESSYDSATDKVHGMTNVSLRFAEHNKKSEVESASSQNATPNSVILASCRTMSSSHTSPVLEIESNAAMNDYDWEYVCNTRQWSESDASTVSSAEMGSAKECMRCVNVIRKEEKPQQQKNEQIDNAHKAMNEKEEIYSKADNTNSFEKNCEDNSHKHKHTDKLFNKHENNSVPYSEEYNDHDYHCQNNEEIEYTDIEHNKHHKQTLQNFTTSSNSSESYDDNNNNYSYFRFENSSEEVDANNDISMTNHNIHNSASNGVNNKNNKNSKLLANNNVKHSEYLEGSAFPLEQDIGKGHNVNTNTENSIDKMNYNNLALPHTHEVSIQDKKISVYSEYTYPTEAASSSSSSSSPPESKLEPSLYYHEYVLEPEWQYVNNECNEHDRIPRVSDEQLQEQRELIGRGGDRGSCVYRLSTKCIPSLLLEEINLLETTYMQNSGSSNVEHMNIPNDGNNKIEELLNEETHYLALKMYPRAMLDNEIEFAEVLYKWQMQHRNREDHNKLHFYSKCVEHEEQLTNDSTKYFTYTTEEEAYAAKHLVISYALIMDENDVDCGILMPLYMCNLKTYLCKNGKEECNIMECDVFDRDACNVFNRHYGNNNSNDNSNNSSVVSSSYNNERSDGVAHITNYDTERHVNQGISNVHINHDNADGNGDDKNNSKSKTTSKRSAFLYKQRYAPIHSMEVITAICFQLLESIAFISVSLGTFCNNCANVRIEENEEMEEPEQLQHYKEINKERQSQKCIKKSRCTGFIHNDIHVSNILLSEWGTVALCDFELVSRNAEDVEHVEHTGYRLPPYARQSPFGLFSASSDTWAFGLIVLNLLTGVDPLFSNTEIMDDFGDGPLLMAYNSQDRRDGVEVLDWEANIKDYVYKLLLTSQLSGEIDVNDATVMALLDVCSLCLVNRPNAQPTHPYQLLQHDIFAPFRADLTLAERIVKEWLEHGKQNE